MKKKRLSDLITNEGSVILELVGGEKFQSKLRTIGLKEGSRIKIIAVEPANGPIVVKSGRTTVTIGRGMAKKIIVE